MCFNNDQRGGTGFREVERFEGGKMHDLGVGYKTIEVLLGMLPDCSYPGLFYTPRVLTEGTSSGHTAAHASKHSVKTYACEKERFHVVDRRFEQPARQRVRGVQVQQLPGSAFSLGQMLSGTVNYRGTLFPLPEPHY